MENDNWAWKSSIFVIYAMAQASARSRSLSRAKGDRQRVCSLYKDDLYKNPIAQDPLVHLAIVQQHVISEISTSISRRVGGVRERDQHLISPIATEVRRLAVSQQYVYLPH
jgi:hypothetical protein